METGFSNLGELEKTEIVYSPKLHFLQRFLEIINALIQADLYLQTKYKM
jgi:hypothetical protein